MSRAGAALSAVDNHLFGLVVASVVVGLLVPDLGALTPLSVPLLAVMVGSISLTLSPTTFRAVDCLALGVVVLVQTGMGPLAYLLATALGLGSDLTLGFVMLEAVTPELVTPTMTEIGGGDTALATVTLVVVGSLASCSFRGS